LSGQANKGVVAAGHAVTAEAAVEILAAGGNAFDAIVAAALAAPVVEPALTSIAGGGFLLAAGPSVEPVLFDFFTQTPRQRRPKEAVEFHAVLANFGATTQEFHVGMGAAATPGMIPGLFHVHRRLCSLPFERLIEPAVVKARDGVVVNDMQSYFLDILRPIFTFSAPAARTFGPNRDGTDPLAQPGDTVRNGDYADLLLTLGREGERLVRDGEVAQQIARMSAEHGGHLTVDDFTHYKVVERTPLAVDYHGRRIVTNPPPSAGGLLIGFALRLLAGGPAPDPGRLVEVMRLTNQARIDSAMADQGAAAAAAKLLDPNFLKRYRDAILGRPRTSRGTTHISVIDSTGNAAALTSSNGEGCGLVVPGTGMMLNNMMGEEDLHPGGFDAWATDTRISSMMAPTLILDERPTALGSGGSNRLRSAILQVLINLIDHTMAPEDAVAAPRLHHERDFLNIEGGTDPATIADLTQHYPDHRVWPGRNMFFGGVHLAAADGTGAGDPRRGGVVRRAPA